MMVKKGNKLQGREDVTLYLLLKRTLSYEEAF